MAKNGEHGGKKTVLHVGACLISNSTQLVLYIERLHRKEERNEKDF